MKRLKLLFFSLSPFVIGYLLNYAMMKYDWYGTIISIIGILFCTYWFFVGYKSYDYVKTTRESILLGNCFAIISIISIIFQVVFMGRFMLNVVGTAPQMFYLPIIRVSSWVEIILLFFITNLDMIFTFILSFVLMIGIYYTGYSMRLKKM